MINAPENKLGVINKGSVSFRKERKKRVAEKSDGVFLVNEFILLEK